MVSTDAIVGTVGALVLVVAIVGVLVYEAGLEPVEEGGDGNGSPGELAPETTTLVDRTQQLTLAASGVAVSNAAGFGFDLNNETTELDVQVDLSGTLAGADFTLLRDGETVDEGSGASYSFAANQTLEGGLAGTWAIEVVLTQGVLVDAHAVVEATKLVPVESADQESE